VQVSQKTIERSIEILGSVLRIYREKIDQAFLKADGAMTVSLGIRYKPSDGKMGIKTSIKFITDQVNDSIETKFDENQADLFAAIDIIAEKIKESRPAKWFAMPDCMLEVYRQ
jgi:hypothetical protein